MLGTHGDETATGRPVGSAQHLFPRLAPVGSLVNPAFLVVVPEVPSCANKDGIAVFGINQNFRDVLGITQPQVGPVLAAVGRFVNTISDRNTISHPRLSRAHPHGFRIRGIDRDGANRLHRLPVEHRLEAGAAIDRFPDSSACRSHEHSQPAIFGHGIDGSDASAGSGGADVANW